MYLVFGFNSIVRLWSMGRGRVAWPRSRDRLKHARARSRFPVVFFQRGVASAGKLFSHFPGLIFQ